MTISPWADHICVISPSQEYVATILESFEIAMGGPACGSLHISGNDTPIEACNSSLVWSDDSKFLAVPQWTSDRMQRLLIVTVTPRRLSYAPGIFNVLELHSFAGGIVRGIDSPIYKPVPVEFRRADFMD